MYLSIIFILSHRNYIMCQDNSFPSVPPLRKRPSLTGDEAISRMLSLVTPTGGPPTESHPKHLGHPHRAHIIC